MINFASNYLNAGMVATRNGTAHPSVVPYQVFKSRDGHVILGVTTDYQFAKFCECAGRSQWVTDDRFATTRARVENRAILVPLVAEVMATREQLEQLKPLNPINPLLPVQPLERPEQFKQLGEAQQVEEG